MALYECLDNGDARFVPTDDCWNHFVGAQFDDLRIERSFGFPALVMTGWVAAKSGTVSAISLRVELTIGRFGLSLNRQDVVSAYPESDIPLQCGFTRKISTVGLGCLFKIDVYAEIIRENDDKPINVSIGSIYGRQDSFFKKESVSRELNPIFVTANGRSGSTYVMRILADHPEIVAPKVYPLEIRHASYCLKVAKVTSEQIINDSSAGDSSNIDRLTPVIGPNPFNQQNLDSEFNPEEYNVFVDAIPLINRKCAIGAIDVFYRDVAVKQGKVGARYFCEKSRPSFVPDLMHEIYQCGAKEIILIRDPRDTHASAIAFNRRRGIAGFGSVNAQDPYDWLEIRGVLFSNVMNSWRRRKASAYLLKYEDIIIDPRSTLQKMFSYLEIDASEDILDRILNIGESDSGEFERHRTSQSSLDSIGRWRRDLPPEDAKIATTLMYDDLIEAGYSID